MFFAADVLRSLLRDQDGVVSRAQLLAGGLSARQIQLQLERGEITPLLRGIYASTSHANTPRTVVYAGHLRYPDACLIGTSSAWWWDLPTDRPDVIEFSCHQQPREVPPAATFRRIYVAPEDRVMHHGVLTQSRPLATIRAAAVLERAHHGRGLRFLDRCIQLGVRRTEMIHALTRHRFCAGNRLGRHLLGITEDGAASAAERKAGRILHEVGITGWSFNAKVQLSKRIVVLDICFRDLKIAVEVDGMAFHVDAERFVSDRQRSNDLRANGWWIIQVTWHDLVTDPTAFVNSVRHALGTRRHRPDFVR